MGVMDYVLALGVPLVFIVALLPLAWMWLIGMTRWRGIWKVLPWTFYVLFMAGTGVGCVRFYLLDRVEAGFFVVALLLYAGALVSSGIAWAAQGRTALAEKKRDATGGDGA